MGSTTAGPAGDDMKKHVLVADDERHTRLVLSLILKRAGFNVTTAEDGSEALSKLIGTIRGSRPFDLLVIDIQMPGFTGIELVEEIGKLNVAFPILLITGYRDVERVAELTRTCCVEYAEKPFAPDELLQHVARVLERFEREQGESRAASQDGAGNCGEIRGKQQDAPYSKK
jgi:DNA-binding NtrC family response regulator